MPAITDFIEWVKNGTLTITECKSALSASEGVHANALWGAGGHALQHSAKASDGTVRRLDDDYHFRGPLPIEKELKGGPNAGKFKAAIEIKPDQTFAPKSNTFHSQFLDDNQAAMCLKMLLQSKGGLLALKLLRNYPRASMKVTFGMPNGTNYINRATHLVAAGRPTSNIIERADMESNDNFVLVDRADMGSVEAILRSKDSPAGDLHVQTLFPTGEAKAMGSSSLEISTKSPADYVGPRKLHFS